MIESWQSPLDIAIAKRKGELAKQQAKQEQNEIDALADEYLKLESEQPAYYEALRKEWDAKQNLDHLSNPLPPLGN